MLWDARCHLNRSLGWVGLTVELRFFMIFNFVVFDLEMDDGMSKFTEGVGGNPHSLLKLNTVSLSKNAVILMLWVVLETLLFILSYMFIFLSSIIELRILV